MSEVTLYFIHGNAFNQQFRVSGAGSRKQTAVRLECMECKAGYLRILVYLVIYDSG